MIRLDPDSMKYTTFLTEEGLYSYKRMPIRDHASMDGYNFRFDKVTERRCVDDSLLYADTMEKAIIETASYLSLMGSNGIIQNLYKFQFGSKEVEWAGAGFTIGADLVRPLAKHTAAVRTYTFLHHRPEELYGPAAGGLLLCHLTSCGEDQASTETFHTVELDKGNLRGV